MAHDDIIPPPSSLTVDHAYRVRLYLADGRPLVRVAGFTRPESVMTQTSKTAPQFSDNIIRRKPGKGGKKR